MTAVHEIVAAHRGRSAVTATTTAPTTMIPGSWTTPAASMSRTCPGSVAEHRTGGRAHAGREDQEQRERAERGVDHVAHHPPRPAHGGRQQRLQRGRRPPRRASATASGRHRPRRPSPAIAMADARYASRITPEPPMRAYQSVVALEDPATSSMMAPKTRPKTSMPTAQASSAPRCSRQTSPSGLSSAAEASPRPRRSARMPRPRSRRVASAPATQTSTTKAAADRASGHQWSPPKGRICWPQPMRGQPRGPGALQAQAARVGGAEHVADAADHEREPERRGGQAAGAGGRSTTAGR